ncbi:MAG: acetyltransferase [Oscillospiraceae bacterium]|nr:acetyltransferase [Oscillospiraceae bacterium]
MMHNSEKLIILGAGGHCRSVLDSIDRKVYTDIAIVSALEDVGKAVYGVPVVGTDDIICELFDQGYTQAVIAIAALENPKLRESLYQLCESIGLLFPTIIDQTAIVSKNATIVNDGVFIGKGAIINAGAIVGRCSIINSGVIIDHDTSIGCFTHVASGVSISGGVFIGNYSLIGVGSSVIQSVEVGENTIVGAGSVVVGNIESNVVAYGNPCKVIKTRE